MKKELSSIPLILFVSILIIFTYLLLKERNPKELPSALIGKNVPTFDAESLLKEEKFISPKEFKNKITLVNFFASWCKPCRDEHLFIKTFSKNEKIKIIGINYKDNIKKTTEWLNKSGNPYNNIVIDKKGKIAIEWGVYGIPETFLVDSDGIIKYRHVGPITDEIFKKINLIIDENE